MTVNEDWDKSYLVPFPKAGAKQFRIWRDTDKKRCSLCSHRPSVGWCFPFSTAEARQVGLERTGWYHLLQLFSVFLELWGLKTYPVTARSSSEVSRWQGWTQVAFEHNLTSHLRQTIAKMNGPPPHHHPHELLVSSFLPGAGGHMRPGSSSTGAEPTGSNSPCLLGLVSRGLSAPARSLQGQVSKPHSVAAQGAAGPQRARGSRAFSRHWPHQLSCSIKLSVGLFAWMALRPVCENHCAPWSESGRSMLYRQLSNLFFCLNFHPRSLSSLRSYLGLAP